ncbi:hypothetical protein C4J97_1463 [Pseudomonas orientalis]|nr:hypothetical protein C4J97_1463 [Pseudomonas orientalis]
MFAKNVNDNACFLIERGACEFFASKLAPTESPLPHLNCGVSGACNFSIAPTTF